MQPRLTNTSKAPQQQLFRALHSASPVERRALALLARGHELNQVARAVGCHPQMLRRRLQVLAKRLGAG